MIPVYNPEYIKQAYLGPAVNMTSSGRIMRKFSHNIAPAFVPDVLVQDAYLWNSGIKIENVMLRPHVTSELLCRLGEAIEDQFEGRIAILWRQSLFLHQTKLNLVHYYAADAQVGMPGKGTGPGKFDCAHMATVGALRVLRDDGKIIALGQGSSQHLGDNITAWLPEAVNQIDCQLDFQSLVEGRTLRNTTICILQSVSQGMLTPLYALGWFLQYANAHLEMCWNAAKVDDKRYIIQCYAETIRCYGIMMRDDPQALMRRLSCISEEDERDEGSIYRDVQKEMHGRFIQEMRSLMPPGVALRPEAAGSISPFFASAIAWFLFHYPLGPTKTVEKYASQCVLNEEVNRAVRNFFSLIASSEEFYGILWQLRSLQPLSVLTEVERVARSAIPVTNPQKMPHILFLIVQKVAGQAFSV